MVTTAVVALVASVGLFFVVVQLTSSTDAKNSLGDPVFEVGQASHFVKRTPLLFQALQGAGDRDIYVQHVGTDPKVGWTAFDARVQGQARTCFLRWSPTAKRFTDPCSKRTYGPDPGPGVTHYKTTVNANGVVVVDFRVKVGSIPPVTTTSALP
jgi:hypothetical protein